LYGTPVPGYHAPAEATDLARRIFSPILAGFGELEGKRAGNSPGQSALRRSVILWTRLHGALSLELAGHFVGMDVNTDRLYDDEQLLGTARLTSSPQRAEAGHSAT